MHTVRLCTAQARHWQSLPRMPKLKTMLAEGGQPVKPAVIRLSWDCHYNIFRKLKEHEQVCSGLQPTAVQPPQLSWASAVVPLTWKTPCPMDCCTQTLTDLPS